MRKFKFLPLCCAALLNACVILNPKEITTGLDPAYAEEKGSEVATVEISRPDKLNSMGVVHIVLEDDQIVGTLTNGGKLRWKSKAGSKIVSVESVNPIGCKVFPGRDSKCFDDKKNQYVRTDHGHPITIKFYVEAGQTCLIEFDPNTLGDDRINFSIEETGATTPASSPSNQHKDLSSL